MTVFKPPEQNYIYTFQQPTWFRQTKTCVGVCHENHADFELKTGTEHFFLSWSFFTTKYQRQNEPSFREGETLKRNPHTIYNEDDRPALSTSPCHAHGAHRCSLLGRLSVLQGSLVISPQNLHIETHNGIPIDCRFVNNTPLSILNKFKTFSFFAHELHLPRSCPCPAHLETNGDFLILSSFRHATMLEWR